MQFNRNTISTARGALAAPRSKTAIAATAAAYAFVLASFGASFNSLGPALLLWRPSLQRLEEFLPAALAAGLGAMASAPAAGWLALRRPADAHRALSAAALLNAGCVAALGAIGHSPAPAAGVYFGVGVGLGAATTLLNTVATWLWLESGSAAAGAAVGPAFGVGAALGALLLYAERALPDFTSGFALLACASVAAALPPLLLPPPRPPSLVVAARSSSVCFTNVTGHHTAASSRAPTLPVETAPGEASSLTEVDDGDGSAGAAGGGVPTVPYTGPAGALLLPRRVPRVAVGCVCAFVGLSVGAQAAVGLWLPPFAKQAFLFLGEGVPFALTAAYWASFAAGRLALAHAPLRPASALLLLTPLAVVGPTLLVCAGPTTSPSFFYLGPWALWVGAAASGIGLSASFSQALAMMESRGGVSRRLNALLCVAAAAGAAAVPPAAGLASYLDGRLRLYAAMLLIACATFAAQIALVGALAAARRPRRRDAARSTLFSRFTFGSSPALSRGPSWWRPAPARESAPLDYTRATERPGQRRGTM